MKRSFKRTAAVFLALVMLLTLVTALPVRAQEKTALENRIDSLLESGSRLSEDGNYYYKLSDNDNKRAMLQLYVGDAEDLVVPETVDGYPVSYVLSFFLSYNDVIRSVTFPNFLDGVIIYCQDCPSLETIYYDLTGSSVFTGNDTSINLGDHRLKKLVFGNNVKVIQNHSFRFLKADEIVFSDSIEEIAADAFADAVGPSELTIPANITKIGETAFFRNSGIEKLNYNSAAKIPEKCFQYCSNLKEVNINGSITEIGDSAFMKCTSLPEIRLPDSVSRIGKSAFESCELLSNVVLNDGLTEIGERAFMSCSEIKNVKLPDSIKKLGEFAFAITGLTEITVPSGLEQIDAGAFIWCYSLKKITLCDGLQILGGSMFGYSDITELDLPDSITVVSAGAFRNCSKLTRVKLGNAVTDIQYLAFTGCTQLPDIQFPETLESIGNNAFEDCQSLLSVTLPEGFKQLGKSSFAKCTALKTALLSDEITAIPQSAFSGCTALDELRLPASLKTIDKSAFQHCEALSEVSLPEGLETIAKYAFDSCFMLDDIVVPDSVTYVGYRAFGDTAWFQNHPDGALYTGKTLYGYKGSFPEESDYVVREGTKVLAEYALFAQKNLRSVTLPDSVVTVCEKAFYGCTGMKTIRLSESLTAVHAQAFRSCSSLEELMLPDSVIKIGDEAMQQCTSLKAIRVPKDLKSFGNSMDDTKALEVVYGYPDSYGERYAAKRKVQFIPLNQKGTPVELDDVNADGVFSVDDATELQRDLAEYIAINPAILSRSISNYNGSVDINNVTAIQRKLAQFE